ncbi:SRPBCC domain-containing protein [Cereibacter sphaeroides]|nr:SRPBCC domain-containing protein [Cereibacter sphaeroides]
MRETPAYDPARRDSAERLIDAPPEACFAAWTEAETLARWLPPEGAVATIEALDPVPGGALRMVLRFTDGAPGKAGAHHDVVRARFVSIEAPHRLVLDVDFPSLDPAMAGTMRMDWRFTPEGAGTRVLVEATRVPPGIDPDQHAKGLASSLDNLARVVAP